VTTITPTAGGDGQPLTLPGTLQGVIESTVYARSNGYVVRWVKDIGSSVKKGELLAEITAPEIDQELSQSVSARAQAAAERQPGEEHRRPLGCAAPKRRGDATGLGRAFECLPSSGGQSCRGRRQCGRLQKLQGFNQVVAPFDGVVTRRNVDVGDLVNAGNGGTGRALFAVAQVDPLRLYVYVPQVLCAANQGRRWRHRHVGGARGPAISRQHCAHRAGHRCRNPHHAG
jgi:multidrug efflux system membrane fusion protein